MMRGEYRFETQGALARGLAAAVAKDLAEAIELHEVASLVVSCGGVAEPTLAALSAETLAWEKIVVTLTDERWVETDDPASHERRVRDHLLVGPAQAAQLIGLKNGASTPEEGRSDCEGALGLIDPPFDVVVLGMGGDGRTASLIPGSPELERGLDLESSATCVAIRPPETQPRMSLTLAALLFSRHRYLCFTGVQGWSVYQDALVEGSVEDLPVRGILQPLSRAVQVYWAP